VGFASPKDDAHHGKGRTLTVLAKSRQATVVDVGQKGPSQGDTRVVNAPLYDKSGKEKVGRIDLYCVATDPADRPNEKANMAECTYAFTLRNGEISAQGVNAFPKLPAPPPRTLDAIIGGTEKYAGVGGEISLETRGDTEVATFHFSD
jgi:hypothetical protein